MKCFEIWTADMPRNPASSCKSGRRPVIIISADERYTKLPFVSIVPLTKDLTMTQLPSHVLLCSRYLDQPSRALCEQITTLDKSCLHRRIGYVEDPYDRFAIKRALAAHLNLTLTTYIYETEDSLYEVGTF